MTTGERDRVLARFGEVILRTPRYASLAARLARDDGLTRGQRALALASLGYVLSPVDLVPGLIPVAGQLDDMAVLIGGLRRVVVACPPEVARGHLESSGLDLRTMDEDLAALRATARWLAVSGARLLGRSVGLPMVLHQQLQLVPIAPEQIQQRVPHVAAVSDLFGAVLDGRARAEQLKPPSPLPNHPCIW